MMALAGGRIRRGGEEGGGSYHMKARNARRTVAVVHRGNHHLVGRPAGSEFYVQTER